MCLNWETSLFLHENVSNVSRGGEQWLRENLKVLGLGRTRKARQPQKLKISVSTSNNQTSRKQRFSRHRGLPLHSSTTSLVIQALHQMWRSLWKSVPRAADGLSDGGVNANTMKLTALGRRLVAPETEGEDLIARREATLKPRLLREFFEKYRRAKLPNDQIAGNVLKSLGLPVDRVENALEIIKANGSYAGIHSRNSNGPFHQS
jgi:hypothetical protein